MKPNMASATGEAAVGLGAKTMVAQYVAAGAIAQKLLSTIGVRITLAMTDRNTLAQEIDGAGL